MRADQMRSSKAKAYFNHAGLGRPAHAVIEVMRAGETEYRDLLFSEAGVARYLAAMVDCRSAIARTMGLGSPSGISLMNNATTAVQLVLTALGATLEPGASVITSDQEHPCVVNPLNLLARRGVRIVELAAGSDQELLAGLDEAIRHQRPAFMILSHVSYKSGRIMPVDKIGEILARMEIPFIVDGSQAIGHIPVDVPATRAWVYIFSGHKWIGGPWGTGGLWSSERFAAINHLTLSNWDQNADPEWGGRYEAGTMNYASVIGFTAACRNYEVDKEERAALAAYRAEIISRLDRRYRLADDSWSGRHAPGMFALLMPSGCTSGDFAEHLLEKYGVAVKPFRPPETPDAIRISCSPATTREEIELLITALNAEACRF